MATTPQKPSFYTGFFEPESPANDKTQPEYRYNHVTETPRGHTFEMDDTPERERIRLSHRGGTFIEMHPNGDEVHKVYGNGYEITIKDKNVIVKGMCNITIEGDCNMHVMGDKIERIDGNYEQQINGNFTQSIGGLAAVTAQGDMRIKAGASLLGSLSLGAGDHIQLKGDLSVDGEVTASKITSTTRVDAGTGMSAGPLGFVTVTGGVAVGIPVAVPQQILCSTNIIAVAGTVSAGTSVVSPIATFGMMDAVIMSDQVNSQMFNGHIHMSPKGPTSTPSTRFI
jgi:hypothetical protein